MKSANIVRYVFTGGFLQRGCPTASTGSSSKITRIKNFLFVFSFVVIFGLFFDIYPAKAIVVLSKTTNPNSHVINQQSNVKVIEGFLKRLNQSGIITYTGKYTIPGNALIENIAKVKVGNLYPQYEISVKLIYINNMLKRVLIERVRR